MLKIRNALPPDADFISALITSLAHLFYASPNGSGAESFKDAITPQALVLYLVRLDINYLAGEEDGTLCGVVALRGHRHLQHLFVVPAFQRRGIGRELWLAARNAAIAAGYAGDFTVNSSMNAVLVYQRFGFKSVGGPQQNNGLIFQPMELTQATDETLAVPSRT